MISCSIQQLSWLGLVLLSLWYSHALAQDNNMVLNGGFERICLQKGMKYITHPNVTTDTLFYPEATDPKKAFSIQDLTYSPVGTLDWQYHQMEAGHECGSGAWYSNKGYAYEGDVFGMIRVYEERRFTLEERQFLTQINGYINNLTATLCRPLIRGKTYELRFFIKAFSGNALTDRIGVAFLDEPLPFQYTLPGAQIYFQEIMRGNPPPRQQTITADVMLDSIYTNTEEYLPVKFTYTAQGGEQYLHIGNLFFEDTSFWAPQHWQNVEQFGHYPNPNDWFMCYYAIDNFSLTPLDDNEPTCPPEIINEAPIQDSIFITSLYFDTDEYENPDNIDSLITMIEKMDSSYRLVIAGHTDHEGSDAYNKVLSQKRAEHIAQIILARIEVPFTIEAYGASQPKYPKEKAHLNRRVDVYLLRKKDY